MYLYENKPGFRKKLLAIYKFQTPILSYTCTHFVTIFMRWKEGVLRCHFPIIVSMYALKKFLETHWYRRNHMILIFLLKDHFDNLLIYQSLLISSCCLFFCNECVVFRKKGGGGGWMIVLFILSRTGLNK